MRPKDVAALNQGLAVAHSSFPDRIPRMKLTRKLRDSGQLQ